MNDTEVDIRGLDRNWCSCIGSAVSRGGMVSGLG